VRYALCVLDPAERGLPEELLRQYEALPQKRGLEFAWRGFDHAAVLTAWDDPWGDPLVATEGEWMAVGVARLDNRAEVVRWTGQDRSAVAGLSDLALLLKLVATTGTKRIRDILGDFAFVAWDSAHRRTIAAVDAAGVRKLFYAVDHGRVAFATRAEALVLEERYEEQNLAELIAHCPLTPGLTAFSGVRCLPAGKMARLEDGNLREYTYWSPDEFEQAPFTPALEREAPGHLRELLGQSVRQRVTDNGDTWAQLSGGLDSSSIVSVAQWLGDQGLFPHGIAGTITFVDWQDTDADEREYSDAVTARWGVPNTTIVDPPLWVDDEPPPHLDQPSESLVFHPRERRLCNHIASAGGRVLLGGFGSDELFTGTAIFFADWIAKGRIWKALTEISRWSALGRSSFWELVWGNAVAPLVPRRLRAARSTDEGRLLPWIADEADRRFSLRHRTFAVSGTRTGFGSQYRREMLTRMRALVTGLHAGSIGDRLDVRYPFLARPLVEFALRLPPELCARPHARKWVLREAMREVLPEVIRVRVGKGGPTDLIVRSLATHSDLLQPLMSQPILADLGVIDAEALHTAFAGAPTELQDKRNLSPDVQQTLAVEAWLQIRSGRWPPEPSLQ
jgi:asparagine synthase (glutamine-hydrolysing)